MGRVKPVVTPNFKLYSDLRRFTVRRTPGINWEYSPKLFRPGSGWISKNLLDAVEDAGYKTVLGSAYVSDSFHPPRWYMKAALDFMLRPGIIVILHDGIKNPQKTIDVLPSLLEAANRKGLNPVILSTLLRNRNN